MYLFSDTKKSNCVVLFFHIKIKDISQTGIKVDVLNRFSKRDSRQKIVMRKQQIISQDVIHLSENEKYYSISIFWVSSKLILAHLMLSHIKMTPWMCQSFSLSSGEKYFLENSLRVKEVQSNIYFWIWNWMNFGIL